MEQIIVDTGSVLFVCVGALESPRSSQEWTSAEAAQDLNAHVGWSGRRNDNCVKKLNWGKLWRTELWLRAQQKQQNRAGAVRSVCSRGSTEPECTSRNWEAAGQEKGIGSSHQKLVVLSTGQPTKRTDHIWMISEEDIQRTER